MFNMSYKLGNNLITNDDVLDELVRVFFHGQYVLIIADDSAYNFGVLLQYYLNLAGRKSYLARVSDIITGNFLISQIKGSFVYMGGFIPSLLLKELDGRKGVIFSTRKYEFPNHLSIILYPVEKFKNMLFLPLSVAFINVLYKLSRSGKYFKLFEDVIKLISDVNKRFFTNVRNILVVKRNAFCLGRGIGYPLALETCSMLKQFLGIHAEGYPAGESKHGPIALIEENFPVISFILNDETKKKMISSIMEMKARGAKIISISTEDNDVLSISDAYIGLPSDLPLNVIPLLYFVPVIKIIENFF